MTQGRTYYVRLRAYKVKNAKKQFGKWSKVKRVQIQITSQQSSADSKGTTSVKKDISKLGVSIHMRYTSYPYTGSPITPTTNVYGDNIFLSPGRDYKMTYENNVAIGRATIKVTGIGRYTGTITTQFEIRKADQYLTFDFFDKIVNVGETNKIDVTGASAALEFTMSNEGIATIDADGTITALAPGRTSIYVSAQGNDTHKQTIKYYVGELRVVNENALSYGFDATGFVSYYEYKSHMEASRNEDGTNTYSMIFYCDAAESWIDNQITFKVEDVTPTAYQNMFADMGETAEEPKVEITSAATMISEKYYYGYDAYVTEPLKGDGSEESTDVLATSGKKITITTGAAMRVIKLMAMKDGKIIDYVYIGSNGRETSGDDYSSYDWELYKKVRRQVEAKIWTPDMTNLQKILAMAGYICETTHYPGSATTSKESNPIFWAKWSVEDKELLYYMCNDVVMNRIMDLQGGVVTCVAAELLQDVATEDLGLPCLYNSSTKEIAPGEGVWIVSGSLSTNLSNPYHFSLKYKYPDESTVLVDAQGMDFSTASGKATCEEHDCASKIVKLGE